jgi:hypothetical protein
MNFGIPNIITDDWKNLFKKGDQLDFYTYEAEIYQRITRTKNGKYRIKTNIDCYDKNEKLVIKLSTYNFGMELYEPELEPELEPDPKWTEQDFSQLTKPIDLTKSKRVGSIYLNNCGTEEWYEFIVYPLYEDGDKIAEICVRRFFMTKYPKSKIKNPLVKETLNTLKTCTQEENTHG